MNHEKKDSKKIVLWTFASLLVLFVVVCAHIYIVMKPKAPGPNAVALARIDFKQNISATDANLIAGWLYSQEGVAHVVCNPASKTAVFSFHPATANASDITNSLAANLHYNATRFIPSAQDMASSCPVAGTSFTYKVYDMMSKIF